jgi:hypothetical protein
MLWNKDLPDEVRERFAQLPSKAAAKMPAKPIKPLPLPTGDNFPHLNVLKVDGVAVYAD